MRGCFTVNAFLIGELIVVVYLFSAHCRRFASDCEFVEYQFVEQRESVDLQKNDAGSAVLLDFCTRM